MTNPSKTIIFFGSERLVSGLEAAETPLLDRLIQAGYHIAAIVAHQNPTRSRRQRPLEVAQVAQKHKIPIFLPAKPSEIINELAAAKAKTAVLSAYGRKISQEIINLFPSGIINLHPSLLPKYRGATPIESAILSGDTITGVSIMRLDAGMDTGAIYAQKKLPLNGKETKFEIYHKLTKLGADLLLNILPSIIDGSLQPIPQDNSKATYCQPLSRQNSFLKPNEITAIQAERMVRAYLGFPRTKINLSGRNIIITKSHVSLKPQTSLDILCKDRAYLVIDELIAPSGKTMTATAFLRGYAAS